MYPGRDDLSQRCSTHPRIELIGNSTDDSKGSSAGLPSYRGYLVIDPFACEAYHRFVLFPYALMITDSNCCNKPPLRYEVREYLCYRARASTSSYLVLLLDSLNRRLIKRSFSLTLYDQPPMNACAK